MFHQPSIALANINAPALRLLSYTEPDREVLLVESEAGSPEGVTAGIAANVRGEQREVRLDGVRVPEELSTPEDRHGWLAAVEEAGHQGSTPGGVAVTLDHALPDFMHEKLADALAAEVRLPTASRELDQVRQHLRELDERTELHFAAAERSAPLQQRLYRWRLVEVTLWVLESLVIFGVCCAYFGILGAPTLSAIPFTSWIQIAAVSLPCVVATFVLAHAAGWVAQRVAANRTLTIILAILVGVGILVFGLALGILRWVAGSSTVTTTTADLGSGALLIIVSITSFVVAGAVVAVRLKVNGLDQHLAAARQAEEHFATAATRLKSYYATLAAQLAELQAVIRYPAELRSNFEQGVKLVTQRFRTEETIIADRVAHALTTYRSLAQLSRPEREALITTLYELRRHDDAKPVPARTNVALEALKRVASAITILCVAVLGGMSGTGCGPTPAPHVRIVVCDGTGASTVDVCSPDLLGEAFAAWASEAIMLPGSAFHVITTAGSYSETVAHDPIVVPSRWEGDVRLSRESWTRTGLQQVRGLPIPTDREGDGRRNQSDLVSAMALAATLARQSPAAIVEGVMASDGWFISLGFNAQQLLPQPEQVLARLQRDGSTWDLAVFSSLTICGFHNLQTTAGRAEARERLWRALIDTAKGPSPTISTTCRHQFPAIPAALPAAPVASNQVLER
jgi:hypothetical protein